MVDVVSFASAVLPQETTTIACDNHEITNVFGVRLGTQLLLDVGAADAIERPKRGLERRPNRQASLVVKPQAGVLRVVQRAATEPLRQIGYVQVGAQALASEVFHQAVIVLSFWMRR